MRFHLNEFRHMFDQCCDDELDTDQFKRYYESALAALFRLCSSTGVPFRCIRAKVSIPAPGNNVIKLELYDGDPSAILIKEDPDDPDDVETSPDKWHKWTSISLETPPAVPGWVEHGLRWIPRGMIGLVNR